MRALLFLILALFPFNITSGNIKIISTPPIPDGNVILMNRLMIQRIFTRKETRWSNGQEITVYIKPLGSVEHQEFTRRVLHMSSYKFTKNLEEVTYGGKSTGVIEVITDTEMQLKVSNTPGSIGYINYDQIFVSGKIITIVDADRL